MRRTVLTSILILAALSSTSGQNVQPSSTAFHWVDSSKDATLFEHIKAAFTDELKPDDPEKVKPVVAREYKWISRIGVFETSALVLVGEREATRNAKGGWCRLTRLSRKWSAGTVPKTSADLAIHVEKNQSGQHANS